jgi:hypothetical protein
VSRVLASAKGHERPFTLPQRATLEGVRSTRVDVRALDVDLELGDLRRELERL